MASERELRNRIRSVKNIAQVTKALEAVSASKVRKAQAAVLATRPYAAKAHEVLHHLATQAGAVKLLHPLLEIRPQVGPAAIILITGDRGLAGPYNMNAVRAALDFTRHELAGRDVHWITVGRKGGDLMWRRGGKIVAEFSRLPATPSVVDIIPIARVAIDEFERDKVDEVFVAYTDFINLVTQKPMVKRLLPLIPGEGDLSHPDIVVQRAGPAPAYIYEPNAESLLDVLLPRFIELQVYQAILESSASEHSARMVAMRNATDSATELVGDLVIARNKARQQAITNDLLDIAGGAEALKKAQKAHPSEAAEQTLGRGDQYQGRGLERTYDVDMHAR